MNSMQLEQQTLLNILYYMKLAREVETRIERKLFRQGKIVGGVYTGRGQEAISVASSIQLEEKDCICPSHRDMGAYIIRGLTVRKILAQYMGRKTGVTGGKDANMHMGDLRHNIVAFISMLADTVPVATGIAMAYKMRRQRNVVLCYFGDGATSRGDWHEGLNLAAVRKVPVIFICNNNQYAYSTPLEKQMPIRDVSIRAKAYNMPGISVDGNDVMAVYEATREAIKLARNGGGPSLIECKTFRMSGHAAHDDARYVSKALFQEWEKKDPILRLETSLIGDKFVTKKEVQQMDTRITQEVDEAVNLAENDPFPDPEETLLGVFSDRSAEAPLSFAESFFSSNRWR